MKRAVAALLVLLALELALAVAGHRTDAELRAALDDPDPRAALFALHVLSNRGDTVALDAERVRALLASEHALAREYAMTWVGTRDAGDELQRAHLAAAADDPAEVARCDFWLRHQVLRPTLARLAAYLAAVGDEDGEGPGAQSSSPR